MRTRLREMTAEDVPAVLAKLKEQNERDGTSYGMAQVFDGRGVRLGNITLALVAVDVDTGEVVQGHVWEWTVEHTAFGIDARATVCSMREQEEVWYLLRQRGVKDEHMLVPADRAPEMESGLDRILGMIPTEGHLKHFYRRMDPAENEQLRNEYKKRGTKE